MADRPRTRPIGGTEYNWCRAVPLGTGVTVFTLLLSKPYTIQTLQTHLDKLQIAHPILRSRLTYTDPITFTIPPNPHIQIKFHDLHTNPISGYHSLPPFQRVLEHEMNQTQSWPNPSGSASASAETDIDTFYCTLYQIEETKLVLAFRIHTSVCDRTSGVVLLKELLWLIRGNVEEVSEDEVNLAVEELIPSWKANKPFWARGVDLLGYSLNSFRFSNLEFKDVVSARSTAMARLQLTSDQTSAILDACKDRGIKLCGALAAAAMMATYFSKQVRDHQWEKYAVATLVDCRKELEPPLQSYNIGFYHSAILNTHDVAAETELWDLASRCYTVVKNAMNSNKHFTDMGDLNLLMCKAIDNPSLTPSSSSRTSLIAVFEDPVFDDTSELHQEIGLVDYVGCSSVHGVGPSIAVFDTVRNGRLDCACVYPTPLHSREQMQELIDLMKKILVNGAA